jgi:hypothetical protein
MTTAQVAEYLPVEGFPGYYVSTDGRVRGPLRELAPKYDPSGYAKVNLRRGNRSHTRYVHRLVLEAFAGPAPAGAHSRHLNGDPTDNRLANLRWGTPAENAADRDRHGRTARGERNGRAKLSAADVDAIRAARASGQELRAIARRYGVNKTTVSDIVARKIWRSR